MWMCGARTEAQGLAVIALRFAKGSVESTYKVPTSQPATTCTRITQTGAPRAVASPGLD